MTIDNNRKIGVKQTNKNFCIAVMMQKTECFNWLGGSINIETTSHEIFLNITIDSRQAKQSDTFVALQGNKDGHNYIKSAVTKGVACVIVNKIKLPKVLECLQQLKKEIADKQPPNYDIQKTLDKLIIVCVEDPQHFLQDIGLYKRAQFKGQIIAITGSLGKTTTKDILSSVCSKHKKCYKTFKSYNNLLGVNLSMANLDLGTELAFFEIGSNNFGEISTLSNLLQPDIAIITNVCDSHIGKFKTLAATADEKLSIIDGLKQNGILIMDGQILDLLNNKSLMNFRSKILKKNILIKTFINYDKASLPQDKLINNQYKKSSLMPSDLGQKCFFFNKSLDNDKNNNDEKSALFHKQPIITKTTIWQDCEKNESQQKNTIEITLPLIGHHLGSIVTIVHILAKILKLPVNNIDFQDFKMPSGRGNMLSLNIKGNNITVIDDSYNAQLGSMKKAIANLRFFKTNNNIRIICALGHMVDQGEFSEINHLALLDSLQDVKPDIVCLSGHDIKILLPALEKNNITAYYHDDPKIIAEKITDDLQDGDVILVKGSRVEAIPRMYQVVRYLKIQSSLNQKNH